MDKINLDNKDNKIYLTNKSVLSCETEYDFDKHSQQTENILSSLNEQAIAGAIIRVQFLDIANRHKGPVFIAASPEDYFDVLNRFDCKNGIDFTGENGEFTAYIYGRNYTAYNEEFMACTTATYHFLDAEQIDKLKFIKSSLEFMKNIDSEAFEQDILSAIYNHQGFFIDSGKIVDELVKNKNYEIDIEDLMGFISSSQNEYEFFEKDLEYIIENKDCFLHIKKAVDDYLSDIKVSLNDIKNAGRLEDEIAQDVLYIAKTSYAEYKEHFGKYKTPLKEKIESAERKNNLAGSIFKHKNEFERE